MPRVEWKRARFEQVAHAVIDGDTLVLCGAPSRKGPRPAADFVHVVDGAIVAALACDDCKDIITEAGSLGVPAAALLWAQVDAWDEGYAAGLTPHCDANPYHADALRAAPNGADHG